MDRTEQMTSPRCSVVFVTWNRRKEMEAALDSVFAQSVADALEVIVVDNGSEDGTVEWLRDEYPHPIRLYQYAENRGCCDGRNAGIRLARAPYVCFLDSDAELLAPDAIERCLAYLDEHDDVRAVAGPIWYDREMARPFLFGVYITPDGHFDIGRSRTETADPDCITTCFSVWEKGLLEELRGFDPWYFYGIEDGDIALRARFAERRGRRRAATRFHIVEGAHARHAISERGRENATGMMGMFYSKEPQRMRLVLAYGGPLHFLRVMLRAPFRIGRMERIWYGGKMDLRARWLTVVWWPLIRLLHMPSDYVLSKRNHLARTELPDEVR